MNKVTAASFIAGSVLGAAGITWAMSDKSARKRIASDSMKLAKKAGRLMDSIY